MSARLLYLVSFLCVAHLSFADSNDDGVKSSAHNPVISHIPHNDVRSTAIASIGYSKRRHILEIEFVNGAIYRYLEVSPSVYRELMSADSKARYYDQNIKGRYQSVHVRPRPKEREE